MEPTRQGNKGGYDQIGTEMRYNINMISHWIIHQDKKTQYVLTMCTSRILGVKIVKQIYMENVSKHISTK